MPDFPCFCTQPCCFSIHRWRRRGLCGRRTTVLPVYTYRKNNSDSAAVNRSVKMFFFQNAEWRKRVCWSSLFTLDNRLDVFQGQKKTKGNQRFHRGRSRTHFCLFLLPAFTAKGRALWGEQGMTRPVTLFLLLIPSTLIVHAVHFWSWPFHSVWPCPANRHSETHRSALPLLLYKHLIPRFQQPVLGFSNHGFPYSPFMPHTSCVNVCTCTALLLSYFVRV